jgi:hypothetical protein
MTKSHGRKGRARGKSRSRGAAYAAANAGTLHQHDSGPTDQELQPADPSQWGVETAPDLRTASALIGACIERCAPCQQSLAAKLLDEDPIVLAVTAGSVYSLQAADQPDAGPLASDAAQLFFLAVQASRREGSFVMLRCVELLNPDDRAALYEDALDLWTFYGHKHPGLMRGQNTGPEDASPFTITVPGNDAGEVGPGTVVDLSGLAHPGQDQVLVQALLLLAEAGVQQVVCSVLAAQHGDGIPLGAESVQDVGTPQHLVRGQVDGEVDRCGRVRPACLGLAP